MGGGSKNTCTFSPWLHGTYQTFSFVYTPATVDGAKDTMRKLSGDDKALPPQIFNDDQYCGVRLISCILYPSAKS